MKRLHFNKMSRCSDCGHLKPSVISGCPYCNMISGQESDTGQTSDNRLLIVIGIVVAVSIIAAVVIGLTGQSSYYDTSEYPDYEYPLEPDSDLDVY